MPLKEYKCPKCGVFEELHTYTSDILTTCPKCKSMVTLLMSTCTSIFNGTGFYETDYKKSKKKKEPKRSKTN